MKSRDYTVKVDVLACARRAVLLRLRAGDQQSTVGKARTLPRGRLDRAKFAVCSCASFPHGFFNAYAAMAARDDVEFVLHLGDYIYEYGLAGYGGDTGLALGAFRSRSRTQFVAGLPPAPRAIQNRARIAGRPRGRALDCGVGRSRNRQRCWSGGADNHNEGEGEWASRKRAALQAYYEWMPIREPEAGRAFEAINRAYRFGDLFTLIMLETRLLARTQQLDYARTMPLQMTRWNFANPNAPVALRPGEADVPGQRVLPSIFEEVGGELRPVYDWRRVGPALANPTQLPAGCIFPPTSTPSTRCSIRQIACCWVRRRSNGSAANCGVEEYWRGVAGDRNQVMMAKVAAPDLSATPATLAAQLEQLASGRDAIARSDAPADPAQHRRLGRLSAARARVLDMIREAGGNTIVVTGDSHTAWANEIEDETGRVAVEWERRRSHRRATRAFSCLRVSISSAACGAQPACEMGRSQPARFLAADVTRSEALAEFFAVSTITATEFDITRAAAFTIAPDEGPGIGALTAVWRVIRWLESLHHPSPDECAAFSPGSIVSSVCVYGPRLAASRLPGDAWCVSLKSSRTRSSSASAALFAPRQEGEAFEQLHVGLVLQQRAVQRRD